MSKISNTTYYRGRSRWGDGVERDRVVPVVKDYRPTAGMIDPQPECEGSDDGMPWGGHLPGAGMLGWFATAEDAMAAVAEEMQRAGWTTDRTEAERAAAAQAAERNAEQQARRAARHAALNDR